MYFPKLPLGSYSIQAHFEDVSSNELFFKIVEPTGDEKEALDLIKEGCMLYSRKDQDPSGRKFQEVVDNFPNSVYSETSYHLAKVNTDNAIKKFYKNEGTFDMMGFRKEMLERFPNSGSVGGWLKSIIYDFNDEEKLEFIKKLIKDKPNSRLAKFGKQIIKAQKLNNKEE